jgi:hypothetical protein
MKALVLDKFHAVKEPTNKNISTENTDAILNIE